VRHLYKVCEGGGDEVTNYATGGGAFRIVIGQTEMKRLLHRQILRLPALWYRVEDKV